MSDETWSSIQHEEAHRDTGCNDKLPLLRKNVVMKRNGLVEAVMTVMMYAYLCVCITEM